MIRQEPTMTSAPWDLFVRAFHWSLALAVFANVALFEEGGIHEAIGYGVAALVLSRILWGLVGQKRARFSAFPVSPTAPGEHFQGILHGIKREHSSHNPLGALMVYNLLASLLLVAATGTMLTTDAFWGSAFVEELHEFLANWVLVSVALHVGGVVFESLRTKQNLVARMIGRK